MYTNMCANVHEWARTCSQAENLQPGPSLWNSCYCPCCSAQHFCLCRFGTGATLRNLIYPPQEEASRVLTPWPPMISVPSALGKAAHPAAKTSKEGFGSCSTTGKVADNSLALGTTEPRTGRVWLRRRQISPGAGRAGVGEGWMGQCWLSSSAVTGPQRWNSGEEQWEHCPML